MEETSQSALRAAIAYLDDKDKRTCPFFVSVDDSAESSWFVSYLVRERNVTCIHLHEFCKEEDSFPDFDSLLERLRTSHGTMMLLGLGDAVRLFAPDAIEMLRDIVLQAKVIVPCSGSRAELRRIAEYDPKFAERQVVFARSGSAHPVQIYPPGLDVEAVHGVRNLLKSLEYGGPETIRVLTSQKLHDVTIIRSAYDAWKIDHAGEPFTEEMLSPEQWQDFLKNSELEGYSIDHWRTFLKLKKSPPLVGSYLSFVSCRVNNASEWRNEIVRAILDVPRTDCRFARFIAERKQLLSELVGPYWNDAEGAEFVAFAKKIQPDDRYAYFTDRTASERQAIIESITDRGTIPPDVECYDPRLADYLRTFSFSGVDGDFWTDYFARYKCCKMRNAIDVEFLQIVEDEARSRGHLLRLPTRGSVLDRLKRGKTGLFWLDALGCEYLGYIQARAKAHRLSIRVTLSRANLPTLTCYNKDFYDDWPSAPKTLSKELDEITHDGAKGFDYQTNHKPIHLVAELDAVERAIEWIAVKLKGRETRRIVLVSDHGASRLAVIHEKDTGWEMGTKGEHSGRCCPKDEIYGIPECATEEMASDGKSYWVLANYDRFKGGRKASVEVHGGASLEEVVVPVIEFTLATRVTIENRTPVVRLGNAAPTLTLFSPDVLEGATLITDGSRYPVSPPDANGLMFVALRGMKRAGEHKAVVLVGDDEVASFSFKVEGRAARIVNDDFF